MTPAWKNSGHTLAASIALAIIAQALVAAEQPAPGLLLYALAVAGAVSAVALESRATGTATHAGAASKWLFPLRWRLGLSVVALAAAAGAFAFSGGNRYRIEGVVCWLVSVVYWVVAWSTVKRKAETIAPRSTLHAPRSTLHAPRLIMAAALLAILALGAAFRFADLADNPREMNSDQAEKLLDVKDVIDGTPYIFFERNTGREPWQFYWTVALIKLFGLQQDFMALKLGTSLIGWLMLPAVFLLARELFGTRTALVATLFAAVASWGVITARFGLRYPLAPCAVAWTMVFLARGLKRQDHNAMLAAGVWLGIGLQGYTAYRFMIVVAPALILVWSAWQWLRGRRRLEPRGAAWRTLASGLLAGVTAILVMAPLIRYGIEHADSLFYRAATRLSDQERPIEGSPGAIFADNVKNVLLMFNVTHDEVWVANLPDRPAMDTVLGGLLVIGAAAALAVSVKHRDPWPALLLASGILMLIPSALSIAFPRENPSVVRTGGALPMLMIVCAIVPGRILDATARSINSRQADGRRTTAVSVVSAVIGLSSVALVCVAVISLNASRVFVDYPSQYCPRAQNASDMAREMDNWVADGNPRANAYLVGYPHWVDARAVGVWLGDITFPNTVGAQVGLPDAAMTDLHGQPGLFILHEEDTQSLDELMARYPHGQFRVVAGSQCAEKRFIVFTVP